VAHGSVHHFKLANVGLHRSAHCIKRLVLWHAVARAILKQVVERLAHVRCTLSELVWWLTEFYII
jgi:hypothetical protein